MKSKGIGKSHAKIILIGEHSVVYGQPAIALPLPNVAEKVTILPRTDGHRLIHSSYFDGDLNGLPDKMHGVAKLIQTLVDHLDGNRDYWDLTIDSDLPAERGMGSSAATAIALVRAFFDYYQKPLDRQLLLRLAAVEEEITHRSPSGLDAATAASSSPLWFVRGKVGTPIPMHLQATMVIADTGIAGATREAVTAVHHLLEESPTKTHACLDQLGLLTRQAQSALQLNEVAKLGKILLAAHHELQRLQVSDQKLDQLVEVAMANGALGAKLTGGGRGGCMFALVKTSAQARHLAAALISAGARKTWLQPLR
ncbi:mevalonate kinase [uncultured Limosilactobacillus sp.]|uniref:mevalonate kinase n=1 Tax=uncultured Limosilactobacillus sp. TaxID=2837629 RepID=UPI0025EDEBB9|nr:mevalonate kinase [uncultured Limosilactobacillus sp.]